ncbi:TRAP transporter small permease [Celeribacter indicus]|uniref:TRAP transporter small permease protein n=1 Tax=Celeribacter indicus TaxID=1208324 RepID=A0A0B5E701_9RHOB|nr:TRAP transporter small permease [Celeribacter indicus]AJE49220.1 hypothetical protein P73_4505 [Celeribacter indicus]SDX51883.1 TRAP-type C4-dicarboxylate transport system, small permease component [Celeribacter indicus]
MKAVEHALKYCAYLLIALAGLSLLAMMIHVFADVVLKYFFNDPIPGTAEVVARYYMVAAVFLPLPLVELRNSGVAVDLFYGMFGTAMRRLMVLVAYLGQLCFFSILAWQSWADAMRAMAKGEYVDGQIVVIVWPASFFLPAGFGIAALVSLLRIVQVLLRDDWEDVVEYGGPVEAQADAGEVR